MGPLTHSDDPATDDGDVEAIHTLARIERLLRNHDAADDVELRIGPDVGSARLSFTTWELNESTRGTLTAFMAEEIATSREWHLTTIHDPLTIDHLTPHVSSSLSILREKEPADDVATDGGIHFVENSQDDVDEASQDDVDGAVQEAGL